MAAQRQRFKHMVVAVMLAAVVSLPAVCGASLIANGNFNDGLTGWQTAGDVRIGSAGLVSGIQGMSGNFALLGWNVTAGTSTLWQSFDVTGLDEVTVSFNWAFDYWDNSKTADDTFLALFQEGNTNPVVTISLLDLRTHGTFWHPDSGLAYGRYSDTISIPSDWSASNAQLVFQLVEASDPNCFTGTASLAGIDNVSVTGNTTGGPGPVVPIPSAALLLGSGLAGLGLVFRRKLRA
jgi:hypothetical protein